MSAKAPIYLDHNASTPLLPEAREAMLPYLGGRWGNPSSTHAYGEAMSQAVDRAREQVATFLDCAPEEVYFTSGGTEANNIAIRGAAEANPARRRLVTTSVEHPATVEPCNWLRRVGYDVSVATVDETGRASAAEIGALCGPGTVLVTVMHANGETGTVQPIRDVAAAAHRVGALVHTDAAQSCGKVPVSVAELGVDLLSLAGHKLYGPIGVGALFVREGTAIEPLVRGAGHERGLRPGTENVAAIVGLGAACEVVGETLVAESRRIAGLRDQLWSLLTAGVPGIKLNGTTEARLPNTLNVRFPRVSGNELLAACPDMAASTGSACHEGEDRPSDIVLAMGVAPAEALGSVRLSLGRANTEEQVQAAASALIDAWRALVD